MRKGGNEGYLRGRMEGSEEQCEELLGGGREVGSQGHDGIL